jgi:hypothetical protein
MKRLLIKNLIILVVVVTSLLLSVVSVAAISTSPVQITLNQVNVYKNCLKSNDMLFWADYTLTYASTPSEAISSTYIMRLVNTGTSTDIRDSLPYAFFENGYNEGLVAIYFSADEVTAGMVTWNSATYYMRLDGNPSATWTGGGSIPVSNQVQSGAFNWKTSTSIGTNQAIITPDILSEAQILQNTWNSLTNYTLLTTTASNGLKLATAGEAYFTNVLPGLPQLAPSVLTSVAQTYNYVTTTPPPTTTIANNMSGSPLDLTNAAAALHVGGMWLGILLTLGIIAFVVVECVREVNSYKPFILLTLPLIYVFTRIGWFPLWLTILLGIAAGFSIFYVFWYEKSTA